MKRALVLFAFASLLAGCDRPRVPSIDALSADPARLHALRAQCGRGDHDRAFCAQVSRADLRRFLSGRTGPDEYQALADLPPIPPSFDGSVASGEAQP